MEVSERIIITKEMSAAFADVSGDYNPIHLDEDAASQSIFGRPVAHGIHLVSLFSKLIATHYPGPGSIYVAQQVDFKAPCYIGDEIVITVKLKKQQGSIYFLDTIISGKNNTTLIIGAATILKK
jgi:3-hydroxybutyryl-CoA dehydratase